MKQVISLLAPTRGRPEQALRLALSVLATAVNPRRVEVLFYVDLDDPEKSNYIDAFEQAKSQLEQFMRCQLLMGEPIGISKAWNELAARSQGNLLIMAADDQTYNDAGWDDRLDQEIEKFPDQIFCMWFNDGHWGEKLCTFPIVSRKWCLTLGYFTTGLFECLYDDLWIMDLAKRLGRLHYISDVLTEHLHWSYGKAEIDATYEWKQVNSQGQIKPAVRRDMNLFGRTQPYRETDAKRLADVVTQPVILKPGLSQIGKSSIFEDSKNQPTVSENVPQRDLTNPAPRSLEVTLHLPGAAGFNLRLNTTFMIQKMMFEEFSQGKFYKPEVSKLLMQVLNEGDCFIDVGAHIGYFSGLASLLVGDRGSVFAVEMDSKNYCSLLENMQINQFTNLHSFNVALGSKARTSEYYVNLDNDGGHALWNVSSHPFNAKTRPSQPTQPVRVETLDRLLSQQQVHNLKLIKIEAEGAEYEVIKGSLDSIQTHQIPYIVCGISRFGLQQMGTTETALRELMASIGYDAYLLRPDTAQPVRMLPGEQYQSASTFRILFSRVSIACE